MPIRQTHFSYLSKRFLLFTKSLLAINSLLLFLVGLSGTLWGFIGALTLNIPPFEEDLYIDHSVAPISFYSLFILTPFTLILYQGILTLLFSITGFLSCFLSGFLYPLIHLLFMMSLASSELYLSSQMSLVRNPNAIDEVVKWMTFTMENYNDVKLESSQNISSPLFNSTNYWDHLQNTRDCCGMNGFDDWLSTSFYKVSNKSFPHSCCNSSISQLAVNCGSNFGWYLESNGFGKDLEPYLFLKKRGCLSTFPTLLTKDLKKYYALFFVLGILILISGLLSGVNLIIQLFCMRFKRTKLRKNHQTLRIKKAVENKVEFSDDLSGGDYKSLRIENYEKYTDESFKSSAEETVAEGESESEVSYEKYGDSILKFTQIQNFPLDKKLSYIKEDEGEKLDDMNQGDCSSIETIDHNFVLNQLEMSSTQTLPDEDPEYQMESIREKSSIETISPSSDHHNETSYTNINDFTILPQSSILPENDIFKAKSNFRRVNFLLTESKVEHSIDIFRNSNNTCIESYKSVVRLSQVSKFEKNEPTIDGGDYNILKPMKPYPIQMKTIATSCTELVEESSRNNFLMIASPSRRRVHPENVNFRKMDFETIKSPKLSGGESSVTDESLVKVFESQRLLKEKESDVSITFILNPLFNSERSSSNISISHCEELGNMSNLTSLSNKRCQRSRKHKK